MSMEPWGQPEPPETIFVILKEAGAGAAASGTGLARERAARARAVNVYFILLGYAYGRSSISKDESSDDSKSA
jgi:hypothetical protein